MTIAGPLEVSSKMILVDADTELFKNDAELFSTATEILPNLERSEIVEQFCATWIQRFEKN